MISTFYQRRPQVLLKWKLTSILFQTLRQPHFFKWKTTSIILWMEDDLNNLMTGRQPQNKIMQPYATKYKTLVVAPLRVT